MAYHGVLDDVRTCGALGQPSRVPIFAITDEFDLRAAGVTHRAYSRDAEVMARVQIGNARRFDYDWVFLIPDDFFEIEPLGVETVVGEHTPVAATRYLPADRSTLQRLAMPDPRRDGRMPAMLHAVSAIKKELGDTICLTGNVAAPFTSIALLCGVADALLLPLDQPELLREMTKFFIDWQVAWGRAQIEAGADAIWLGDCVASSAFLSPAQFEEFALPGAREVCAALKDVGALVFYHAGENRLSHLVLMAGVRPTALSVGERNDLAQVKKALGAKVCLMGNIDGIQVVERQGVEDVRRETRRILEAGKPGGAYIFNSGEGIPYGTPDENVAAMIQTGHRWAGY